METVPLLAHSKYGIKIGVLLLLVIGSGLIAGSFATLIGNLIWGSDATMSFGSAGYMRFIQAMSAVGTFAIPAMLFSYLQKADFLSYSRIDKTVRIKSAVNVTWMAIVILPLIAMLSYLNEQIQLPALFGNLQQWMKDCELKADTLLQWLTNDNRLSILLLNMVILGILPGVCEEWLFRGTIQPLLQEKISNKHVVIWLTAFIFSAIHLQFSGFIPRMLLGGYLGYLAIWSGSLWLPVLAHVLHNVLSLVINFFSIKQGVNTENLDPFTISFFLPVVFISLVMACYGLYRLQLRR